MNKLVLSILISISSLEREYLRSFFGKLWFDWYFPVRNPCDNGFAIIIPIPSFLANGNNSSIGSYSKREKDSSKHQQFHV